MLIRVDLTTRAILLAIDLPFLRARKLTTIRRAIMRDLMVDALLPPFKVRRLIRVQAATPNTLSDAILLILPPLADVVVAIMSRRRIVLIDVDVFADMILLLIELRPIRSRQPTTIRGGLVIRRMERSQL